MKKLFLIFALLLFVLPAEAAIAFVQSKSGTASTGTTVSATFTTSVSSGSLLVAQVYWNVTTATSTVTDNVNSSGWTNLSGDTTNSTSFRSALWYLPNSGAGSITITATLSAAITNAAIAIHEISGAATLNPVDGWTQTVQTTANTSPASGNLVTTNANDYLFGGVTPSSNENGTTAGTGWTLRENSAGIRSITEDNVVSATGTYNATFTLPFSAKWNCIIVAFKAAGGAPAPTPQLLNLGVGAVAYAIDQNALNAFQGCLSTDTTCLLKAQLCDETAKCLDFSPGSHQLVLNFLRNGAPTAVARSTFAIIVH